MRVGSISRRSALGLVAGSAAALTFGSRFSFADAPLKVGIPIWVGWMPFWIMDEKKIGDKHKLNAVLTQFTVQTDARQALAARSLDVCALNTADILAIDAISPVASVITLTNASAGADIVIARGVDKITDLKGKKVALEIGSVSHFFFSKVLEKAGLTENDVNIVNMSAQDAGSAFVAKAIDVSVTWEPFASQGIASGGKALITSKDTPNLIIDVISARDDVLKARKDDVKRLLDAWYDALAFVDTNKDEAFAIMAKHSDVKVEEFAGMWAGVKMYSRPENIELMGTPAKPGPYVDAVRAMSSFMVKAKLIPSDVAPSSMIDGALLA
ncbi:MAG: ABC transporter substrate-binding protein [Proteobacteria bacterium]|nr:ABC transporter substrate-binding protein [Pseudomonadota bacterium]